MIHKKNHIFFWKEHKTINYKNKKMSKWKDFISQFEPNDPILINIKYYANCIESCLDKNLMEEK